MKEGEGGVKLTLPPSHPQTKLPSKNPALLRLSNYEDFF